MNMDIIQLRLAVMERPGVIREHRVNLPGYKTDAEVDEIARAEGARLTAGGVRTVMQMLPANMVVVTWDARHEDALGRLVPCVADLFRLWAAGDARFGAYACEGAVPPQALVAIARRLTDPRLGVMPTPMAPIVGVPFRMGAAMAVGERLQCAGKSGWNVAQLETLLGLRGLVRDSGERVNGG